MTTAVISHAIKSGVSINYNVYDNKREFTRNFEISEEIGKSGKYDAVIGTLLSAEGVATANVLAKYSLPFFVSTATNPNLTKDKPFVVPLLVSDTFQAEVLAK